MLNANTCPCIMSIQTKQVHPEQVLLEFLSNYRALDGHFWKKSGKITSNVDFAPTRRGIEMYILFHTRTTSELQVIPQASGPVQMLILPLRSLWGNSDTSHLIFMNVM